MLDEKDFEIIEKQANTLYFGLEYEIIQEIAERIANVGYANTVVKNDVKIAQECNILYQDIIKMVSKYNESNESEVLKIFQEAGIKALRKDDKIYKSAGLDPKGLSKSMQQLIGATAKRTHNNLSNLTLTTANTSQTTFLNAINKSYLEVSTGIKSYSQSIMDAIKDVANQGATIQYPSGRNINIESAVRMNIVTSVNQNSAKLQEMRAEELRWDLVEVSAHSGARPEHAEWQGKVYSLKGKTKGYKTLADGCGYGTATGLCGVNCRHTFFPFYKGSTKTYTTKELNKLKNEKIKYNGKEYSVYEASQIQRQLERNIRNTKKDIASLEGVLKSNNSSLELDVIKNKLLDQQLVLKQSNSIFNEFLEQTKLKKDNSRLVISNLSKIDSIPKYKNYLHKGEKLYKENEIYKIANATKELANKYTNNESKWSGEITFSNRGINAKLWSCKIEIEKITSTHNILHEQLHAHSISYYDRNTYVKYKKIEEGTVELFTREICKKENIEITKSQTNYYDNLTNNLYEINKILKIEKNNFDFAKKMFEIPVIDRLDFLEKLAYNYKINATIQDAMIIDNLIGEFYE